MTSPPEVSELRVGDLFQKRSINAYTYFGILGSDFFQMYWQDFFEALDLSGTNTRMFVVADVPGK